MTALLAALGVLLTGVGMMLVIASVLVPGLFMGGVVLVVAGGVVLGAAAALPLLQRRPA